LEKKLKFGIWRHENSIGNSIEQTIALAKHLARKDINPKNVEIYVEHEFQRSFVLCIPGVEPENIKFFTSKTKDNEKRIEIKDIIMPDAYPDFTQENGREAYPSTWSSLSGAPDITLKFDEENYENHLKLPKDAILIFHREQGTWWKRIDGSEFDQERFVDPEAFHKLALTYANMGYKVVKLGDKRQKALPGGYTRFEFGADHQHKNLIDLSKYLDDDGEPRWTIEDYLFLIQNCKLFISCDAGFWPMAAAMKKNLVFCNVTSCNVMPVDFDWDKEEFYQEQKTEIVDWMPAETTSVIFKRWKFLPYEALTYDLVEHSSEQKQFMTNFNEFCFDLGPSSCVGRYERFLSGNVPDKYNEEWWPYGMKDHHKRQTGQMPPEETTWYHHAFSPKLYLEDNAYEEIFEAAKRFLE